jgi:hypothetical protein
MRLNIKNPKDKEWVGKILYARRRIAHLNKWGCNVYSQSVLDILDDILPPEIVKQEVSKDVRKRKNVDGNKDGNSRTP